MFRRVALLSVALFACADSTQDDTGGGTTTSASASSDAGSGTASTSSSETSSTEGGSTTMGSSGGATIGGSSGTGNACPEAAEPSGYTEVDNCAEAVGQAFCSEGQAHVEAGTEIDWQHDPPHSGPHYPTWELWGEHEETVPRGNWVHNLEHGGIVLLYLCPGGYETELAVLRQVVEQRPELRILLTPDPELPGERFAAVSWTWVHRFDAPDLDTLLCFVDQHENHAPEDVP